MGKNEKATEKAKGAVEGQDLEVREVSAAEANAVKGGKVTQQEIVITKPVDKASTR